MSQTFSIADLPIVDDLDVPVSAEDYVDQANPAPAAPGNYRMIVTKHSVRTTKDGKLLLVDGKFPVVVVEQVKIIEPTENERLVGVFTDIRTKPFTRKGPRGMDVPASDLQDILRSFDATISFEGFEHMKQLLAQHFDQQTPFNGQLKWGGYDAAYVKEQFGALNATTPEAKRALPKDVVNAIYNTARKGTKDFVINGVRVPSIIGPSGDTLDAKVSIGRYFPSNDEKVVLGPFKK